MLLIVARIWHLSVIQYDQRLQEARRPQKKIIMEPSKRATIRDRYNLPLAINQVRYQAAVLYSDLKAVHNIQWEYDTHGKKIRIFKRREYIKQLSNVLADELKLDPNRVEDLIFLKRPYFITSLIS